MLKRLLFLLACALLFAGCDAGYGTDETHPVYRKAISCRSVGKYKEAESLLKRFLKSRPKSARGCLALAQLYDENLNDPLSAVYYYREFLKLEPNSTESRDVQSLMKRCEERLQSSQAQEKKTQKLADENIRLKKTLLQYGKNMEKLRTKLDETKQRAADAEEQAKLAALAAGKKAPAPTPAPEATVKMEAEKTASASKEEKSPAAAEFAAGTKDKPEEAPPPAKQDSASAAEKENPDAKEPPRKTDSLSFVFPAAGLSTDRPRRAPEPPVAPPKPSPQAAPAALKAVPNGESENGWPKTYIVKPGDSLSAISRNFYGTTQYYTKIMEANQIKNTRGLAVGQKLILPAPETEVKK